MLTMREVILKALIDRKSPPIGTKLGLLLKIFYEDGEMCKVFYDKPMVVYVGGHGYRASHTSVNRMLKDATSVEAIYHDAEDILGFVEYTYPQENSVNTKLV